MVGKEKKKDINLYDILSLKIFIAFQYVLLGSFSFFPSPLFLFPDTLFIRFDRFRWKLLKSPWNMKNITKNLTWRKKLDISWQRKRWEFSFTGRFGRNEA